MAAVESRWLPAEPGEVAELLVESLAENGVRHIFFTSGSDIMFLQEAVEKLRATGRKTPEIVTVMHESVGLHMASGDAMVGLRPSSTAWHVDVGTLNAGTAVHSAGLGGFPVLMLSGSPARSYPGTMRGARDHVIYWQQERQDQRELVKEFVKWRFRLEFQDNPGLTVSRAIQVMMSGSPGPGFLSIPREVGMAQHSVPAYPTAEMLGFARPAAPDPEAIDELAGWLLAAERPVIVTGRSGKDPRTVAEMVRVAELSGATVTDAAFRDRMNFPVTHPLYETGPSVAAADVVLVVDRKIPWVPAAEEPTALGEDTDHTSLALGDPARAPGAGAKVAWIHQDPLIAEVPIMEFCADARISADPYLGLKLLADALEDRMDAGARERAQERLRRAEGRKALLLDRYEKEAHAASGGAPMDPRWVAYQLGRVVDDEAIFLEDTLSNSPTTRRYNRSSRPHSFFAMGSSGGGWGPGAAVGAKLADPGRDVILAAGDGFYTFGIPTIALWTAQRYDAPYLTVVYENRRYSTGTNAVDLFYPDGYAAAAGYPGGRFDPAPDFAAEAKACGAHGERVTDGARLEGALQEALEAVRGGQPAVVSAVIT